MPYSYHLLPLQFIFHRMLLKVLWKVVDAYAIFVLLVSIYPSCTLLCIHTIPATNYANEFSTSEKVSKVMKQNV